MKDQINFTVLDQRVECYGELDFQVECCCMVFRGYIAKHLWCAVGRQNGEVVAE
jgi:hypothetical protein